MARWSALASCVVWLHLSNPAHDLTRASASHLQAKERSTARSLINRRRPGPPTLGGQWLHASQLGHTGCGDRSYRYVFPLHLLSAAALRGNAHMAQALVMLSSGYELVQSTVIGFST